MAHYALEQSVSGQLCAASGLVAFASGSETCSTSVVSAGRLRPSFRTVFPREKTFGFVGNSRRRGMQGMCYVARKALLLTHDKNSGSLFS